MPHFTKPEAGSWTEHFGLDTGPVSYADSISPDHYGLEQDAIFRKTWLNVGRVEQLPRKGRLGLSGRSRAALQESQGISAQPNGALVDPRPSTPASRRAQADLRLGTAHFERADVASQLLGDVVRPHAALRNHLRDGGQHCFGQNSASHSHPLIGHSGSMFRRLSGAFGSI